MSKHDHAALLVVLMLFPFSTVAAQYGGSRAGVTRGASSMPAQATSSVKDGYIAIDGRVELRVQPTEIRAVLAVTAEGTTANECKQQVRSKIALLTEAWKDMGIAEKNIVEDFIAVLPRYEYELEEIRGREVAVEKKVGYLMQSNMHLAVKDDSEAMRAINLAFENDVTDIIAFDYWSDAIDSVKKEARAQAMKVAREKSDLLLALFEERPPIINLQEQTQVHYPQSQYQSFDNSSQQQYVSPYISRRDIPRITAFRPKNTYYRGLKFDGDVQSKRLPMQSEISVVATVNLYYESPMSEANDKKE